MTTAPQPSSAAPRSGRLPLAGLLALGTAGFVTIMAEALPAGILPAMSADLGVTEAATGQTVTVYAIGSAVAAVPLTAATIGWPRRRLLLLAISGFAVANTVTAVSHDYVLTMAARFVAGVVAGLLWAPLAGYARRMVAPGQRGKAMAIAMAGAPVALSIGVPAGTFLANLVGWRLTFGIMTLVTLVLIGWVVAAVPGFPGQAKDARLPPPGAGPRSPAPTTGSAYAPRATRQTPSLSDRAGLRRRPQRGAATSATSSGGSRSRRQPARWSPRPHDHALREQRQPGTRRVRLRHSYILSARQVGKPDQMSPIPAADPAGAIHFRKIDEQRSGHTTPPLAAMF